MLLVKEVISNFNIPRATAYNWRNSSDWRKDIYDLLANMENYKINKNDGLNKQIIQKELELTALKLQQKVG